MSNQRSGSRARRPRLRRSLVVAAATAATLLLAACSGSGAGANETPSSSAKPTSFLVDGKPTELSYWSFTTGSQQAIDEFNKTHKDIHVTFTEIPAGTNGGYTKLFNAFKAGSGPDVFNVEYPFLPDFVSQGDIADVTKYVTPDLKKKFLPQSLQLTTLGGHTYGIPYDLGVQVLFYRADLFDKYGLTVPKTWDEYRADAEKLKAADPNVFLSPTVADDGVTMSALSWQAGAKWFSTKGDSWHVNVGDAPTKKVAGFWQNMIADGLVSPTPNNTQAINAAIANGTIISQISASWNAAHMLANFPSQSGQWKIAPLPSWNGSPASGMNGGSAWAISKSSKSVAASAELATWMSTNADAVRARVSSGQSSPYLSVAAMNKIAQQYVKTDYYKGQDYYKVFDTQGHGLKSWTWGPTMTDAFNAMNDALGNVGKGGSVLKGLEAGQTATVDALKSRGVKVTQG
ncbi:ABC transporter substrate-binding protein [Rathayibacter sp. CAU 1779]